MKTEFQKHSLTWLREAVRKLSKVLRPVKILLYGSFAYGQPSRDSDIDLLIIMESKDRPAERIRQVSALLQPRTFPIDVLVLTPGELQDRLNGFDPFLEEVLVKGRVLYER